MNLSIDVDLTSIEQAIKAEQEKVNNAVRPMAQAGAQVLYEAVKANVQAIGKKTGNLDRSIYQAFSEDSSSKDHASYHISWNARKAPHGHLVEFGHIQKYKVYLGKNGKWYTNRKAPLATPKQVAARSFVRKAIARFPEARQAMEKRFVEEMGK